MTKRRVGRAHRSSGGLPVRIKAYHRALKRGERWAKLMAYEKQIDAALARIANNISIDT